MLWGFFSHSPLAAQSVQASSLSVHTVWQTPHILPKWRRAASLGGEGAMLLDAAGTSQDASLLRAVPHDGPGVICTLCLAPDLALCRVLVVAHCRVTDFA